MQNKRPEKFKENEAVLKVFLSTLTRLGNALIIIFGVLYYGIRKVFYIITKKENSQTLYEFITKLDNHLNAAAKPQKPGQYKKPYQNKKAAAGKAYSAVRQNAQAQKKVAVVKVRPTGYRAYLPKIAVAVLAAAVVTISVFVFKGIAAKEKEPSLKQTQALAQATGSVYEGKITKRFSSGLKVYAGEEGIADREFNRRKITESYLQENNPSLCSDEPLESTEPEPVEVQEPGTTQIDPELMLHKDETNALVPLIQERLMDLFYMDADEPTDFYGQQTEYAVQLFQRGHGLMVDGVAGYESLTLLFSDEATPYLVHKGDKGWDIKQVQKRLKELGYLTGDYSDEIYDEVTYSAIRAFQGRNKLDIDGVIGHNTLEVIFNGDAKPASSYKPPSGGDSGGSSGGDGGSYNPNNANALVSYAKAQMNKGYTYIWGGKSPPGMDCSGFVYYCLKQTGNTSIGYKTSAAWAQSSYATISSIHDAKPGDILCFKGHVAICIGGGKMIDSSSSSNAIRIANYESSSYWNKKWICAKRVFP